jgi:8-oxo-dGTP pyrophosphatase MutT (NUDIX family)
MQPFDLDGPNPWRTTDVRVVFEDSRLRLHDDLVVQPDGAPGRYAYLEVMAPVVAVVALDSQDHVYLVRQWRYPWGRNSWELPSGGGEQGENPLMAAQRELAEEVGVVAANWEALGQFYASATMNSHWHFFLARNLRETMAHQRDGAEEDLVAHRVPLPMAIEAAMDGRIQHGMSIAGILRAARRLGI